MFICTQLSERQLTSCSRAVSGYFRISPWEQNDMKQKSNGKAKVGVENRSGQDSQSLVSVSKASME